MQKTRTISARLTPEEQEQLLERAASEGLTPSEFFRQRLLNEVHRDALRIILAEVREMRTILFELAHAALAHEALTDARVRGILSDAEARRFESADGVLTRIAAPKQ